MCLADRPARTSLRGSFPGMTLGPATKLRHDLCGICRHAPSTSSNVIPEKVNVTLGLKISDYRASFSYLSRIYFGGLKRYFRQMPSPSPQSLQHRARLWPRCSSHSSSNPSDATRKSRNVRQNCQSIFQRSYAPIRTPYPHCYRNNTGPRSARVALARDESFRKRIDTPRWSVAPPATA